MQTDNTAPARSGFIASAGRARSFTSLLMRTTALPACAVPMAFAAVLASLAVTPAMADGGNSGSNLAGGGDSASAAGSAGTSAAVGQAGGGGGGGAGVTGGSGGSGAISFSSSTTAGGLGGATAGASGTAGESINLPYVGGGGGGGGAHGYVGGGLPSSGVSGGNGGAGGYGDYYGGGGGAGGWGAVVTGSGSGTLTANVTGGTGGAGGGAIGQGGSGGTGGTGLYFTGSYTATILGTVSGGTGGAGGVAIVSSGASAAGGVGLTGGNLTVIAGPTGSIVGGMSGDGVTQSNAVTFTGGTNVFELQAGATVSGNVVAYSTADTFRLGGTAAGSFDVSTLGSGRQYQGFGGSYSVMSGSTWTLTGTATSANPWTVNGTAYVNGDLSSSSLMTVNPGGTLGGNGKVDNLTFTSGSTYNVTSAGGINVTGTAVLGGATVNAVFGPGSYLTKQSTILHAATLSGAFGSLQTNGLPSNFTSSLINAGNDVRLNLTMSQPGGGGNLNRKQSDVSNAIANAFNGGGSVPIELASLTPAGLTQASGEVVTASQQATFNAMNMFMGILTDPYAAGRGGNASPSSPGAMSYAQQRAPRDAYAMFTKAMPQNDPFASRWTMWASGFGGSQTTNGNNAAGSNTSTSSIFGVAVGADYRISPNTLAGFGMSGGGTNFSVANGGSGRSDMLQAGGFVRHAIGASYLTAAATYAWQDVTTNRNVIGTDQLQGRFNANAFSGRFEAGTRYIIPSWMGGIGATPYAAVQVTAYDLPAYTETVQSGPGVFALGYAAKDVTSTRSELGLRTDRTYALTDSVLTLRGRFAWAHEFDPDRSIGATFQSVPGASFVVNGARQASDAALTTASAELRWRSGVSLAGIFEGEFSDVTRSYAGKGVLRYQW